MNAQLQSKRTDKWHTIANLTTTDEIGNAARMAHDLPDTYRVVIAGAVATVTAKGSLLAVTAELGSGSYSVNVLAKQ